MVQTALGLPSTISAADIDTQAKLITSKIDLTDFQDPAKVTKFVQRFARDVGCDPGPERHHNGNSTNSALVLIGGASSMAGLDTDMLTKLQTIRFGK